MRVFIIRHAKSSWEHDVPDRERPLSKRGRKDAPKMARRMIREGLVPDFVLCSDALRAMETWDLMQMEFDRAELQPAVEYHSCIYDMGHETEWSGFHSAVRSVPTGVRRLGLVGHNPGLESLVQQLSQETVRITTCNVVELRNDVKTWADFFARSDARLGQVLRPREPRQA